ncbi:transposase mutator [Rhodopirellula sp. SWK7]|nr:transposase mutator [Rhodopirellula sp. SWK7]
MLLTFYDFPAERLSHPRTTNSIESTFATIWLCPRKTKGSGFVPPRLAMTLILSQVRIEEMETPKLPRKNSLRLRRAFLRRWN